MKPRISWLDFKLGARRLIRYPGLTLVGGFGMAIGVAVGVGFFAFSRAAVDRTLPLEADERVVGIEVVDAAMNRAERRILHDFATWREELESVEDLAAFRTVRRNLIVPEGPTEPVRVAEMTPSGFRVARVSPRFGRSLVPEDADPAAPPVAVIGYDAWRTHFGSDPEVLGRSIQLGETHRTVVGVMPEGFAFPVNHQYWIPLRADPTDHDRRAGPAIFVFGRLAPGVGLERARAELATTGRRTAAAFPETHEHLRPRVVRYVDLFVDDEVRWTARLMLLIATLLLVVIAVNIAALVYARTVSRQGEIAVRSALGASRGRIIGQLFAEALVLTGGAALVGLVLARLAVNEVEGLVSQSRIPFWIDFGLPSGTVLYTVGLVALATVIVGVVPALKVTGRRLQSGLRRLGGGTGMGLGRTWTALIVGQVAFAVAILPFGVFEAWESVRYGFAEPGFAAEEFLTARIGVDRAVPRGADDESGRQQFLSRYGNRINDLARRLETEREVATVTFASHPPGMEPTVFVEVEGVERPTEAGGGHAVREGSVGHEVRSGRVDVELLDAFDVPILTGRGFASADLGEGATAVIVNRSFVDEVLGGDDALGRRVRYVGRGGDADPGEVEFERWYEIVGVAADFPNAMEPGLSQAKVYHPVGPGGAYPVTLALRIQGTDPASFAPRLRQMTMAVAPGLQALDVLPLAEVLREEHRALRLTGLTLALVTLAVLSLSAAGIYALVSFTVARRRREIGIRAALGAKPGRILGSIFSRTLGRLLAGVVVGLVLASILERLTGGELTNGNGMVVLPLVTILIVAVGLLAAYGPARKGLRIQPTEALKAEG